MTAAERRIPRVPFVRPCSLLLDDGQQASACLVNLSTLGAYVSQDDPFASPERFPSLAADAPRLGQLVRLEFVAGSSVRVSIDGRVSWLNPRQQHPVHSLPPGFGVQFQTLSEPVRAAVQQSVEEWLNANPGAR